MDKENKNNEEIDLSGAPKDSGAPKIIQWTIKYSGGLVKDEKQASYVLLGFVAVAVVVTLFLIFASQGPKIIPKFREDIEPEVRTKLPPGVFETIPSKYDKQK